MPTSARSAYGGAIPPRGTMGDDEMTFQTFKGIEDIGDAAQAADESAQRDRDTPKKALIAFFHGKGIALVWSGPSWLHEFVNDLYKVGDGFSLDDVDIEHAGGTCDDGLYICDLDVFTEGPDYFTGERDSFIQAKNLRPATAEEWESHVSGDWPWDMP